MNKAELRQSYKEKRRRLSNSEVKRLSLGILSKLQELDFSGETVFHIFLPIPKRNEVDTYPIIDWLFALKKTPVVPAVQGEEMNCCELKQNEKLKSGAFGTLEPMKCRDFDPQKIDVILMPMLICDKAGNRVGYGGGYYDRFLKKCWPDILKIGLGFFAPVEKVSDVFPGDIALDYCVTSDEIVSFTKG